MAYRSVLLDIDGQVEKVFLLGARLDKSELRRLDGTETW